MSHPMADLQKAVFDRLSNDSAIVSLVGEDAIYDRLLESEAFPYIAIGRASYSDWSTSSDEGAEIVLTIHIWDRAHSRERIIDILDKATEALKPDLVLEDHRTVVQTIEFSEVRREPNSQDFHGLARLRVKLEAIEAAA
jgi:hypothetical protein